MSENKQTNNDLEERNGMAEEQDRQAEELWGMLIRETNESRISGIVQCYMEHEIWINIA